LYVFRNPERRQTPQEGLNHPWIKGFKSNVANAHAKLSRLVHSEPSKREAVQRIQRFGEFSKLKQAALEHIAGSVLRQDSVFGHTTSESTFLDGGDDQQVAQKQQGLLQTAHRCQSLERRRAHEQHLQSLQPIQEDGSQDASEKTKAAFDPALQVGAEQSRPVSSLPSVQRTSGLLEHMMLSDGTVRMAFMVTFLIVMSRRQKRPPFYFSKSDGVQ
jgi:hypothetical protein